MTTSHQPPDQVLDDLVREHGFMNFTLECVSRGLPARVTMNADSLYLAVSDGTLVTARFRDTDHAGTGVEQTVRVGDTRHDLVFADAADAERFVRVLDVRRGVPAPARPLPRDPLGDDPIAVAGVAANSSGTWLGGRSGPGLRTRYERSADVALLASGVLIGAGMLIGFGGLLIALIALVHGSGIGFLYGIVLAVLGSATPFCLGYLTRTVVYRFAWEDASAR